MKQLSFFDYTERCQADTLITEDLITIEWPVRARVAVPVGRWRWDGDRIVAEYTKEELGLTLFLANAEKAAWKLLGTREEKRDE